MQGFSVIYRNPGHWDIARGGEGRLFRIRGDIGRVYVMDERDSSVRKETITFRTVQSAFAYIADELMFEPLASDGDKLLDSDGYALTAMKD